VCVKCNKTGNARINVTLFSLKNNNIRTYSEYISIALGIQYAMRVSRIMLSVACLVLLYFATLSHKRRDFLNSI
jgi:hypothetical protein